MAIGANASRKAPHRAAHGAAMPPPLASLLPTEAAHRAAHGAAMPPPLSSLLPTKLPTARLGYGSQESRRPFGVVRFWAFGAFFAPVRRVGHFVCLASVVRAGCVCFPSFFFGAPFSPNKKKDQKQITASALGGLSVCRLCCSCLSFCIASHQSKDKKLFCFGRLAFCFALPRLPPTKEKDKKLFCFARLAFCFFFASLGGGYIHIYIYTEQMRLYLKRPLGAARKTPRKPKT